MAQWAWQQSQDPQTLEQALAAAQRAITLNDSSPVVHWTLGIVYLNQRQYEPAIAEMERVIALAPNEADGYASLGWVLSYVGRPGEAMGMVEQALRRNPNPPEDVCRSVGSAYSMTGRSEEAITWLKRFLARYPDILGPHLNLAAVYSELGQKAEARAEAAEVLRLNPRFSLELHKQRVPIKDPVVLERHLAALRKAGLR